MLSTIAALRNSAKKPLIDWITDLRMNAKKTAGAPSF